MGGHMIDKSILEQYAHLLREREDIRRRIQSVSDKLSNMQWDTETVYTGRKSKHKIKKVKIEGTASRAYSTRRTTLLQLQLKYQQIQDRLDSMIIDVEEYIQSIDDSRIRQIIRLRYEGDRSGHRLTWREVAIRMHETEDSCRKACERYLMIREDE